MNKAFSNFTWENEPSENTAVNAENLNKINNAIDTIDSRVVTHETTKLDKTTANTMVKDVVFDSTTGIFTITKLNGSVLKIDTKLEKLAVNFNYDKNTQILSIILDDGTTQEVDLSSLITQYEFAESDTIILTVGTDGKVVANIKDGSITGDMLEPNYLANVTIQANNAASSANTAKTQADRAETEADRAEEAAKEAEAATGLHIDTTLSSTSVNPVQNKVIKSALDTIQTASSGTLSEAGWYRVAEYPLRNGNNGNSCDLSIKTKTSGSSNCSHKVRISRTDSSVKIKAIDTLGTDIISKIRLTYDSSKSYIELYYNVNASNPLFVAIDNPKDYANTWKAITPTLTNETDGVTVTTTYDIPSNASSVTSETLTTSILEKALTLSEGTYHFRLGGGSYKGTDLPNTSYNYGSALVEVQSPSGITIIVWGTAYSNTPIIVQYYNGSSWRDDWKTFATTSDLATELAKYLPKTGGAISGNLQLISDTATSKIFRLKNSSRSILICVYADGRFRVYDETNNKDIINSALDGTNIFNGTATGNLPLNGGGTVNGQVLVNGSEKFPLALTNNANTGAYISFWDEYEMYGALGFNGETFAPEFYDYGMRKHYPLLHTGNSNAVIVASSAPSDTTALWYDTTNKTLKRYVDGAWQQ